MDVAQDIKQRVEAALVQDSSDVHANFYKTLLATARKDVHHGKTKSNTYSVALREYVKYKKFQHRAKRLMKVFSWQDREFINSRCRELQQIKNQVFESL